MDVTLTQGSTTICVGLTTSGMALTLGLATRGVAVALGSATIDGNSSLDFDLNVMARRESAAAEDSEVGAATSLFAG